MTGRFLAIAFDHDPSLLAKATEALFNKDAANDPEFEKKLEQDALMFHASQGKLAHES